MDGHDGVAVKCRPDFIIRPLFETSKRPVAIFTDGFTFHKDIVSEAIRKSGNYVVWSLSYKDVQSVFQPQGDYFTETLCYNDMYSGTSLFQRMVKSKGIEPVSMNKMSSLELLFQYLSIDNSEEFFSAHAEAYLWSLINPGMSRNSNELSVWEDRMNELNSTFWGVNKQLDMGSIWAPRDNNSHLTVYSGVNKERTNCAVFAVLNDTISERTDKYEAEWNGFWRLINIMQFFKEFIGVTQRGLDDNAYSVICDFNNTDDISENADTYSSEWSEIFELLEYSDEKANALVKYAMENNMPVPTIGYEASDENGKVKCELEVAWVKQKIGYITEENIENIDTLKNDGWILITDTNELSEQMNGGKN